MTSSDLDRPRRLPAEWEPQSGVMLTWPHPDTDWAADLAAVETVYCDLALAIAAREPVLVVVRDAAHQAHVDDRLRLAGVPAAAVRFAWAPSDDTWARDHGPITVLEAGRARLLDFTFNGWGGKFSARQDDAITARLHAAGLFGDLALDDPRLVLEGGAIESDGQGTLLARASAVVDPRRNPGVDRAALERRLGALLGVDRVLWLEHGDLLGDDTDGHIDTLARFSDPQTIAFQACDDPGDVHYAGLSAMRVELSALRTRAGVPYRLVPLPLPRPALDRDGRRLPAGYANFLIVNGAVLVPTYADPADAVALERLESCFPDRQMVGIDCQALIRQNGSLHCITMQLPAGVLAPSPRHP